MNCEIELILTWSKNCALTDMAVRAAADNNDPPAIAASTVLEFQIRDTNLHVSAVTLSKENDKDFLELLKSGFKRTVKWNKYRSQMTVQSNNNNLNYLINSTFTRVSTDCLFCHLKELKKTMLKKIIDIIFHTLMCLCLN